MNKFSLSPKAVRGNRERSFNWQAIFYDGEMQIRIVCLLPGRGGGESDFLMSKNTPDKAHSLAQPIMNSHNRLKTDS